MKTEVRADGTVHISGYVNVPMRESRPIVTPRGKCQEVISAGAFRRALERAPNVSLLVDHIRRPIASIRDGTLELREDNVGLHADAVTGDPDTVAAVTGGKIRGWSFNMFNVTDHVEERAGKLPLRTIEDFDMDEVTLVVSKNPCYTATSFEVRADGDTEVDVEVRSTEDKGIPEKPMEDPLKDYKARFEKL